MQYRQFDQTGHEVSLCKIPVRIISLVPSQTELLYDLGLCDRVVGITKFCCRPTHWAKNKTKVGGTKTPKINLIQDLNPDLIIANKEENTLEDIKLLRQNFPVWTSDIANLKDALEMIKSVGTMTGTKEAADEMTDQILVQSQNFRSLFPSGAPKRKVCYLIWKKPYMSVGGDTFIHSMLDNLGFENVFANKKRYPEVTLDEILSCKPEYIFLSSEPYPFKPKDMAEFSNLKAYLVDGESFSWYGSRLLHSFSYFRSLVTEIQSFS